MFNKQGQINGIKCPLIVLERLNHMRSVTNTLEPEWSDFTTQELISALQKRRMSFFSNANKRLYYYYPYTGRLEEVEIDDVLFKNINDALQTATITASAMGYDCVTISATGKISAYNHELGRISNFSKHSFWVVANLLAEEEDIMLEKTDTQLIVSWY